MNEKELASIRFDYYSALADYGIPHDTAWSQSTNKSDLNEESIKGLFVEKSKIHGLGLIAGRSFNCGEQIALGREGDKRTIAGRYTNHSPLPNSFFSFAGENIALIAKKKIQHGEEILVDYREALSLQIVEPEKVNNLVALSSSIGIRREERTTLRGITATGYDLLFNPDHLTKLSYRERVLAFEAILEKMPQAKIEPTHEFIDGLYRRQITFPAGTMATGKIHTADHMDVVLSGEMIVATEDGYEFITGPCCRTSTAGRKKAGLAITDCTWVTYHPTNAKTVEDVEAEIFAPGFDEIEVEAV